MLLALLAWNCQKEEQQMPPNEGFHFLESKFSLENFDDPFIKENLKVNWNNYTINPDSLSNALLYQFDTSIKGKLDNNDKQFEYKYLVLGQKQGNEWDFEIIKILANNDAPVKNITLLDFGEFSGTIHHYDLKGNNTKSMAYEKGRLVSEMTGVDGKDPTAQSKEPPVSDEGTWVLITVERYTDWYYDRGGYYEYAFSAHNSTQHEWAFIYTGGTHSTYGHEQGDVYHGHHAASSAPSNPPDNHEEEYILYEEPVDPSCESFDYYTVGNTGTQVAGVNGVWDVVTRWGRCPGIGVAASYQTYYFHLPSHWNRYYAAERSSDALAGAFFDLQKWFENQPCSQINTGVLALKMDEFIKYNFQEIGGQATRNAPLGWLGTPRQYKEDWSGTDDCY